MNQQQSYQQHHLHNQHLFNDSTIIVARKLTTIHVFEHIFTTQVSPTARTHSFSPHSIGLRFGLQSYYATKNNNHNHSNTNKIKKAVTSKILLLAAGSDSSCNHHNHNHQNQLNTARSSNDRTLPFHGKNADSFPARATNLNNSHMKPLITLFKLLTTTFLIHIIITSYIYIMTDYTWQHCAQLNGNIVVSIFLSIIAIIVILNEHVSK